MDLLLQGPLEAAPSGGRSLGDTQAPTAMEVDGAVEGDAAAAAASPIAADGAASMEVRSLKCDDCGKILRTEQEAQAHAARTQHANFSQSTDEKKALTTEEKAAQFAMLQERMAQKKAEKIAEAASETKMKEKVRRIEGQKKSSTREENAEREMKKAAAEMKREKAELAGARAKVKAQMEQDRIARKAKFDAEKAERHGAAPAPPAHLQGTAAAAAAASPTAAKEKKVYTSCKIRLQLKPPLSNQFDATDSVDAIFEWARTAMGQAPDCEARPFNLVMNRPRKVFSAGDVTTIADSGLMPSAALQIAYL